MIICYYIKALSDIHSSIAQSVEHAAVNRRVVGSSPTGGATRKLVRCTGFSFFLWLTDAGC